MQSPILYSGQFTATASGDSLGTADSLGNFPLLNFSQCDQIAIFVVLKSFTGLTNVQILLQTGDGQSGGSRYWANLNSDAPTWTSATNQYHTSAGPGTSHNDSLGVAGKIAWTITGTGTCTFYVTVIGKTK